MNVKELTDELVGSPGHQKIEVLLTLSIVKPDKTEQTIFLKVFADEAASSSTRDRFYISCDTIHAVGNIMIDSRNHRENT